MDYYAFQAGYNAYKNGCNINNSFPYTKENGYWDWKDGWRKAESDMKNNQKKLGRNI